MIRVRDPHGEHRCGGAHEECATEVGNLGVILRAFHGRTDRAGLI
jgi:hypothetical protein